MRTRIQKWGNSLALRVPKTVAKAVGFREGLEVELAPRNGSLVVRVARFKVYRLEDLLKRVTPKNRHPETDWGAPMGREVF